MKPWMHWAAISVCLALAGDASAASGDWPRFRGANHDSLSPETGLLRSWPDTGLGLAWKATGCGSGYSSVAVAAGRVFTMGDGADASAVHCYDVRDGRRVWTSGAVGKPGGNYDGTRGTPTVDGDLVFALGQFGDLVCLDVATGRERWRKSLVRDFGGTAPQWNYSESPLVDGDRVIISPGGSSGTLAALDRRTGQLLWRTTDLRDVAQYSGPVPADIYGQHQYVQLTMSTVAGIDAATGKVLWRTPRNGRIAVIPTPVIANNLVYVTSGYGVGCGLLSVTKDASGFRVSEAWANRDLANHHGGVLFHNGHIYGHSEPQGWTCQELRTGKVRWTHRGVGKGSVTFADGMLYCRSEGGRGAVALVEATPQGYFERGRFDQPDRSAKNTWAHPVVTAGKLFLRDQGVLLCYNVKK